MEDVVGCSRSNGDRKTHGPRSDVIKLDWNAAPKVIDFFIHGTISGCPMSACLCSDGLDGSSSSMVLTERRCESSQMIYIQSSACSGQMSPMDAARSGYFPKLA